MKKSNFILKFSRKIFQKIIKVASLQEKTTISDKFNQITKNLVSQVVFRNKNLPPTKAVEITNLVGCEAIK